MISVIHTCFSHVNLEKFLKREFKNNKKTYLCVQFEYFEKGCCTKRACHGLYSFDFSCIAVSLKRILSKQSSPTFV